MLAVLSVEALKLKRSLAALLAIAAPTLIAIFVFFNMLRGEKAQPWDMYTQGATAIWAFFMLPMSVTALTALVAHMEHGPRAWDHLRALPIARWKLYAAKAICVLAIVAVMSVVNLLLTWGAVALAAAIKPVLAPNGVFDPGSQLILLGKIMLAATLMIAIAVLERPCGFPASSPRSPSALAAPSSRWSRRRAKEGVFFPWQMPINMLSQEPWRSQTALALGGGLGAVVHMILAVDPLGPARSAVGRVARTSPGWTPYDVPKQSLPIIVLRPFKEPPDDQPQKPSRRRRSAVLPGRNARLRPDGTPRGRVSQEAQTAAGVPALAGMILGT